MTDYTIRVANDDLIFSASHFITFEGGGCEPLHGHDYRVSAEVCGPLNANQYVIDFVVLRDTLKKILGELDHRVLVPQNHPRINIQAIGDDLEITFAVKRWVLPKTDCVLLPVPNTTSEMLAKFVAGAVLEQLAMRKISLPKGVKVEVGEGNGFTAIYHLAERE